MKVGGPWWRLCGRWLDDGRRWCTGGQVTDYFECSTCRRLFVRVGRERCPDVDMPDHDKTCCHWSDFEVTQRPQSSRDRKARKAARAKAGTRR